MARLVLLVAGQVQGVNFRSATKGRAVALGLRGWVQNLPDGRVRIVAAGPKMRLQALLEWCYHGVANARVEAVDARWEVADAAVGEEATFDIR